MPANFIYIGIYLVRPKGTVKAYPRLFDIDNAYSLLQCPFINAQRSRKSGQESKHSGIVTFGLCHRINWVGYTGQYLRTRSRWVNAKAFSTITDVGGKYKQIWNHQASGCWGKSWKSARSDVVCHPRFLNVYGSSSCFNDVHVRIYLLSYARESISVGALTTTWDTRKWTATIVLYKRSSVRSIP